MIVDDIPVARRSTPPLRPVHPLRQRLLTGGAGLMLALLVVLLTTGALRRWLQPPPVPGLAARPSADGRLLGHFPYAEIPADQLVEVAPGQRLHRAAAAALQQLLVAAAADGVELVLLSGFRPVALQKDLFFAVKSERNQSALERAQVSAPPGYSEHSTGYAVDLGDAAAPDTNLAESFEDTAAYAWLQAHARRYHFTLSFPRGNAQGVSYEPWHWRYEGSAEALKLFEPAQRLVRP